MRPASVLAAVMLALTAVVGVLLGSAEAAKDRPKLKITKIEPSVVAGKLTNKKKACVPKRTVVLKYKPPTAPRAGAVARFQKLGTAKTNKKGRWKRPGNYFVGTYKAILKPKTVKTRVQRGRKEPGVEEEEVDESDELDEDAEAARTHRTRCTGTNTKSKER